MTAPWEIATDDAALAARVKQALVADPEAESQNQEAQKFCIDLLGDACAR
ncbi:hypothetical protein [Paraburkholderia sp. SIMBA_030]